MCNLGQGSPFQLAKINKGNLNYDWSREGLEEALSELSLVISITPNGTWKSTAVSVSLVTDPIWKTGRDIRHTPKQEGQVLYNSRRGKEDFLLAQQQAQPIKTPQLSP